MNTWKNMKNGQFGKMKIMQKNENRCLKFHTLIWVFTGINLGLYL